MFPGANGLTAALYGDCQLPNPSGFNPFGAEGAHFICLHYPSALLLTNPPTAIDSLPTYGLCLAGFCRSAAEKHYKTKILTHLEPATANFFSVLDTSSSKRGLYRPEVGGLQWWESNIIGCNLRQLFHTVWSSLIWGCQLPVTDLFIYYCYSYYFPRNENNVLKTLKKHKNQFPVVK